MSRQLLQTYRQAATEVPDLGDSRRAWRRGRRQRRVRIVGAPIAVAALSAAVVVASTQQPWDGAAPEPTQPQRTERTVEPTRSLGAWIPETPEIGRPAPIGALMYVACPDGCEVMLRRPNGSELPLADVAPEAAAAVDAAGVEAVGLSYDGQWLGVPDGDGYVLYDLSGDAPPHRLASHDGSRWTMVGVGSFNWSFARWEDGRVVEYATGDLFEGGGIPQHFDVPGDWTTRPLEHTGDGVLVSEPVATDGPPSSWPRLTSVDATWLTVLRGTGVRPGTTSSSGVRDLSALLASDETLAGPRGVYVERTGPIGSAEMDWPTVYVFDQDDDTRTPIGAIVADDREPAGGWRFAVPESTVGDTWRVLGSLRAESLAVAHETADATEVVRIDRDGSRSVLQRLPAGSQVILPGASPIG
jgi:hypothetical protein